MTDMVLSALHAGCRVEILPLLQVSQQDPPFGHKLGAVAHQANTVEFSVNGIVQFTWNFLFLQDNGYFFRRGSYFSRTADNVAISSWALPGIPCRILVISGSP